jgi:hypothetical protein
MGSKRLKKRRRRRSVQPREQGLTSSSSPLPKSFVVMVLLPVFDLPGAIIVAFSSRRKKKKQARRRTP